MLLVHSSTNGLHGICGPILSKLLSFIKKQDNSCFMETKVSSYYRVLTFKKFHSNSIKSFQFDPYLNLIRFSKNAL